MIDQILRVFKRDYQTLNKIEISKENLLSNFKYLSSLNEQAPSSRSKKVKIAPVLKSNAYGHGLTEVARILAESNISSKIPFVCVDSLYEAYELSKAKIKTPILIMGYTDPENFKVKKLPFSFAVFDIESAKILNECQKGSNVHIFVDTGMNREGISLAELPKFLEQLKKLTNIKIEGLMSHLASADDVSDSLNKVQIKNFKKALEILKKHGFKPKWIHLLNSDGLLNSDIGNLARVGLALYGISRDPNLKPVLSLKTKIIQIKRLNTGNRVGYGGTFTAKKPMTLGVLPLGYYDGVDRRLSNKGFVQINKLRCPIIGNVSMNITTIDLSKIRNPYIGQEVNIYPSIETAAKISKTIPYDILASLSASTKRVIV